MISFEKFVMTDNSPIYLQIVLFIKREIAGGVIVDGDEMLSRRTLSSLLGVNPNTVQKAYRILEDEKLISSHSGAKSTVVLTDDIIESIRKELLETDAKAAVRTLKQMGVTKSEAFSLIERFWDGDEI